MHNASPVTTINYWRNCTEGSDDRVILEWNLNPRWLLKRIFARFLEQPLKDLVSWKSPGECSMIDLFLGDTFGFFFLPILQYCSAVWCLAADTHLKLLDRAVSIARFLTGGVFECDIDRRRSVAVLCMLYKIGCNLMHPLNGALPGPYVPVRVTRGALVAHLYTYVQPHCRTSQYRRTFIALSVSLRNDLADPVFDGVGLAGFKSRANAFCWPKLPYHYYSLLLFFHFSSFSL